MKHAEALTAFFENRFLHARASGGEGEAGIPGATGALIDVGAGLDELICGGVTTGSAGHEQGGEALVVAVVEIRAGLEEKADGFGVAALRGLDEGCGADFLPGLDVGAVLQEEGDVLR